MKIFELDLSGVELPEWWVWRRKILATPGQHKLEFDILDEELNHEFNFMRLFMGEDSRIPVGFNSDSLPIGAAIRRIAAPTVQCPAGHRGAALVGNHIYCPVCWSHNIGPDDCGK